MTLDDWQQRLAGHFAELQRRRRSEAPEHPVFALEHGLDLTEVEELSTSLRSHLAHTTPSRMHWLPWIVYAAEIGYGYAGDEYWQTFEEQTPGWTILGNRNTIRDWYRLFSKEFGGAVPCGVWAEHFSIICWPITHAVLPKDLQRQLARILFELRHSFSAELFESPSVLGEHVAARSWNTNSRFHNLAQDTQLVGQIATALLLQGELRSANLIHPPTLKRIGEDLERERLAREWLRGARRLARERAQIRGLGRTRYTTFASFRRAEEAREEVSALGIEPRLVLRPLDAGRGSWQVYLEIPDLSHLLLRFPKTRDILTGSRCVISGATGGPRARGWCLYGSQRVTLARWPQPGEVLLRFDTSDPQLDFLLSTECLLRPGPTWLFRIASDGLAHELRSLRARPDSQYIVVSTDERITTSEHARAVELNCEGVYAAAFDLPAALDSAWETELQQLGLGLSKTIEVWPAGLAAALWDGEGRGEWLASERPCLGICTDHPVAALTVSMGSSADLSLELTPITPGEPIFVQLPPLPVGLHTVSVSSRGKAEGEDESLGTLDVVMRIREKRPWSPGASPHGPLVVHMDPVTPTLEELWEGNVNVSLRGPAGHHVKGRISLFEREGGDATVCKQLPRLALPVLPGTWKALFDKHFREVDKVQTAYDAARICELEFKAGELGAFVVRCEREFRPLRWAVRKDSQGQFVRLVNDSGSSASPSVTRSAFERPCIEQTLETASEYRVPPAGGMYRAQLGDFAAAVIASPRVAGLDDLRCVPRIDACQRSSASLVNVLATVTLWGRARLSGDLFSRTRQRDVLFAFLRRIFEVLCGENWARAETAVQAKRDSLAILGDAVSKRRDEAAMGVVLARDCATLATVTCNERVTRLSSLGVKFLSLQHARGSGVGTSMANGTQASANDSEWLSELALRLASAPATLHEWAGQYLREGLAHLLEQPTLARAARFLVIATDLHLESRTAPDELYASWGWT